jgi:hypothetical protein
VDMYIRFPIRLHGLMLNQLSTGTILPLPGRISPGVERPGHEADHSPPSSAEVKNSGTVPHFLVCLRCMVLN